MGIFGSLSCLVLVSVALVVALQPNKPKVTHNPPGQVTTNKIKATVTQPLKTNENESAAAVPDETVATSLPQQGISNASNTSASPKTSPAFISASTHIEEGSQPTSQTCNFTAVMTASALYHSGEVAYANHVISFTLSLRASDNSASFSQTYSYTFGPGETKEFRLSGSFKKPLDSTTYTVSASGMMALSSGSASLGPNTTYNAVASCGAYSPLP